MLDKIFFCAVLNKDIPLGKSLNALAHISLGIGHRLDATPGINIHFGSSEQVKKFRGIIHTLKNPLCSDFTDTMTGETAREQLEKTFKRKTDDLVYYASCGIVPQSSLHLFNEVFGECSQVNGYKSFTTDDHVSIKPFLEIKLPEKAPDMKASMLIKKGISLGEQLNLVVISCLEVGRKANLNDLHLLDFVDADGISHPYISYHPFPILNPTNVTKHKAMEEASHRDDLAYHSSFNEKNPLISVVFGNKDKVDAVFQKKQTSLYKQVLSDNDLSQIKMEHSENTQAHLLSNSMQKSVFNSSDNEKEVKSEPSRTFSPTNQ